MISKILIAHNQELIRDLLGFYIKENKPSIKIFFVDSGRKAIDCIEEEKPEVVILSFSLNELSGVKVLDEVKKRNTLSKFIILYEEGRKEFVSLAKEFGANGFLSYQIAPDLLIETLFRVAQSDLFICQEWFSLKSNKNTDLLKDLMKNIEKLSKQETKVLRLFCNKLNTKEAADELAVRTKSIDNYKNRIATKLSLPPETYFIDWVRKNEDFLKLLIG